MEKNEKQLSWWDKDPPWYFNLVGIILGILLLTVHSNPKDSITWCFVLLYTIWNVWSMTDTLAKKRLEKHNKRLEELIERHAYWVERCLLGEQCWSSCSLDTTSQYALLEATDAYYEFIHKEENSKYLYNNHNPE